MKIGMCGAGSTGKTVLMKLINKKLGLPEITEVSRSIIKSFGLSSTQELFNSEIKPYIQFCILLKQISEEHLRGSFISERSAIDNLAYWEAINLEESSKVLDQTYRKIAINHIPTYDYIIYCPIEFALIDDGFRGVSENDRKTLDLTIRSILKTYFSQHRIISVYGSPEDRLGKVLEFLGMINPIKETHQ